MERQKTERADRHQCELGNSPDGGQDRLHYVVPGPGTCVIKYIRPRVTRHRAGILTGRIFEEPEIGLEFTEQS